MSWQSIWYLLRYDSVGLKVSPGRAVQKLYISEKIHKQGSLDIFDFSKQHTGKLTVDPSSQQLLKVSYSFIITAFTDYYLSPRFVPSCLCNSSNISDYSPVRLSNSPQGAALNCGRLLIMLSWYIYAKKTALWGFSAWNECILNILFSWHGSLWKMLKVQVVFEKNARI